MQDRVKPPAICLMIVGAIGSVVAAYLLVGNLFGFGTSDPETLEKLGMPKPFVELSASSGYMVIVGHFIQIGATLFVVLGGMRMMKLRSWGLGFAASIVAMLPCISPCCLLGVPAGAWCLFVLMKPEIKDAFSS